MNSHLESNLNAQSKVSAELYLGLMCGTSIDGVDVALVDFSGGKVQLIATYLHPIDQQIKTRVRSLCQISNTLHLQAQFEHRIELLGNMDQQMGLVFAGAINQFLSLNNLSADQIVAVGSHGQTIRHQPTLEFPFTLQIGDPNIIAHVTGIKTIADFRRMDMAAGGQGAPLAPAFHNTALRSEHENRIILNLGGIANITVLPKNTNLPVIGFDTGTANTLMDAWFIQHHPQSNDDFDRDSKFAKSGEIQHDLLELCLADPYFKLAAPKSTGREYFSLDWLKQNISRLETTFRPADVQRTLLELTVQTIADAIKQLSLPSIEVLSCGGGSHNLFLIQRLQSLLNTDIYPTDKVGVNGDYLEAITFAWLARQRVHELPGNLPSVTGAKQSKVLGAVYLP